MPHDHPLKASRERARAPHRLITMTRRELTALSVVLTCCPPAPLLLYVSILMSSSRITTSTSVAWEGRIRVSSRCRQLVHDKECEMQRAYNAAACLRENGHRGGRRVDSPLRLGEGHTLHLRTPPGREANAQ